MVGVRFFWGCFFVLLLDGFCREFHKIIKMLYSMWSLKRTFVISESFLQSLLDVSYNQKSAEQQAGGGVGGFLFLLLRLLSFCSNSKIISFGVVGR